MTEIPMVRLTDIEVVHYWPSVATAPDDEEWYGVYPSLEVAEAAILLVAQEWWPRNASLPELPDEAWEAADLLREHDVIYIHHIDDYDIGERSGALARFAKAAA